MLLKKGNLPGKTDGFPILQSKVYEIGFLRSYYRCRSPKQKKLYAAFEDECEKQGIIHDMRAANRMIRAGYNISGVCREGDACRIKYHKIE